VNVTDIWLADKAALRHGVEDVILAIFSNRSEWLAEGASEVGMGGATWQRADDLRHYAISAAWSRSIFVAWALRLPRMQDVW
jgi:hypothetical protein